MAHIKKLSNKYQQHSEGSPSINIALSTLRILAKDEQRYDEDERRLLDRATKALRAIAPRS